MQMTTFGYGRHRTDTLILAAILRLEEKVDALMSQDATIAAEAAAEETDIQALTSTLGSLQGLLTALQGETGLSETTLAAAARIQTDLDALAATAQADLAADQPPAPPPPAGA